MFEKEVSAVKITRTALLEISENHTEDLEQLNRLMAVFCSALRYSFNRLVEGEKEAELRKIVQELFHLNKRYAEDAVMQAKAVISSQEELLPIRLEGVQAKIQKTERKMSDYQTGKKTPKKVTVKTCLEGLHARLTKLKEKESILLKHQQEGSMPSVIFGKKENFYKRLKGKITNKEWKDLRSNTLYSRGDKSKKGNLNIRIIYCDQEQQFYLEVANPLVVDKGKKSPRLRFKLHIPDKYISEIADVVMPITLGMNSKGKPLEEFMVYSIELKRKKEKYYVHMTYDRETAGTELEWNEKITSDLIAGIDLNIDRVAVSILTSHGNWLESRTFYCHEMEYVKRDRRSNIAGEVAKEIIDYLLSWNVGAFVLEELKFKQDHDTNHKFNRLVHSFAKKKLQKALISRGMKFGFKIKKVNPAYTSVIGRFKYAKKYGLSVHEAASFVIGRRGLDFEEKIPKELLRELKTKVKPILIQLIGSMEESEKQSTYGKQRRQFLGMLLQNIDKFKENHRWKLWNVVNKTLIIKNQEIQLKEVYPGAKISAVN
jgi:IS605 OrfB family transposase